MCDNAPRMVTQVINKCEIVEALNLLLIYTIKIKAPLMRIWFLLYLHCIRNSASEPTHLIVITQIKYDIYFAEDSIALSSITIYDVMGR